MGLLTVYLLCRATAFETIGADIAAITINTAKTMGHFFLFIIRNERLKASLFINNPPKWSLTVTTVYLIRRIMSIIYLPTADILLTVGLYLNGYLTIAAFLRTGCHRGSISVDLIFNILLHYMPLKRLGSQKNTVSRRFLTAHREIILFYRPSPCSLYTRYIFRKRFQSWIPSFPWRFRWFL